VGQDQDARPTPDAGRRRARSAVRRPHRPPVCRLSRPFASASTTGASSSRPRTPETYSAGMLERLWPLTRRCTSSAHSGQVRLASCSKRFVSAKLSVPAWRRLDAASSCSLLVISDCQSASTLRPGSLPRLTLRAPSPIWARRSPRPPAASGGPGAPHRGCVHIQPTTGRTATSSELRLPRPRARRVRRRAGALSASRSRILDLREGREGFDSLGCHFHARVSGRLLERGIRRYYLHRWPSARSYKGRRQDMAGTARSNLPRRDAGWPWSPNEEAGKPREQGAFACQRLSFGFGGKTSLWKRTCEPRPEPDSGNPTVRDRRGV